MTAAQVTELPARFTHNIELIDPDTARAWLDTNTGNRRIDRNAVARYAEDLRSGHWPFTGDTIKFAVDGRLIDGQHRLLAIIDADVTVEALVVRNLDPGAQVVVDNGKKRTIADSLALRGEANATTLAGVAGLVITNGGKRRRPLSPSEVIAALDKHPSIREAANAATGLRIRNLTPSVAGYCYWRLAQVNPGDTTAFFTALATLANLPSGSPILALHRKLETSGSGRSHAYRREIIACVFHSWNAYRRGETRALIKTMVSADGTTAIPKPI